MQSFRATTPDLLRGERGWMSQIKTAAPGGGRKMFLTSPFIDLDIPFYRSGVCTQNQIVGEIAYFNSYPNASHDVPKIRSLEAGAIDTLNRAAPESKG